MAQSKPRDVFFLSGKLCADPTNLATAFPHGGTALGDCLKMAFSPGNRYRLIHAEEHMQAVAEAVRLPPQPRLAAVLRNYDFDALSRIFPNVTVGAITQTAVIKGAHFGAGMVKPGSLVSDVSFKLLFSPDDPSYDEGIIIYNALPLVEEAAAIELRIGTEFGLPVAFTGMPRSDGLSYSMAKLKDLAL